MRMMEQASGPMLLGLVSASGSAGVAIGAADAWRLVVHFAAWRPVGGPVNREERRCELPVSKDELSAFMARIKPYQIIEVEPETDGGEWALTLRRIVRLDAHDPELAQLAVELQQPVTLHSARFGTLRYESQFGWFAGNTHWGGQPCRLTLECTAPRAPDAALANAEALFADEAGWRQRIEEYAAQELLDQANDWREEDAPELTREAFVARITVEAIGVDEAGELSFFFDDGDLFAGHAIQITGDLANGPTDADTPG